MPCAVLPDHDRRHAGQRPISPARLSFTRSTNTLVSIRAHRSDHDGVCGGLPGRAGAPARERLASPPRRDVLDAPAHRSAPGIIRRSRSSCAERAVSGAGNVAGDGDDDRKRALRPRAGGAVQLPAAPDRIGDLPRADAEADPGAGRRRDDRRQPARLPAARGGPPADLLLPARGCPRRRAAALRSPHALPEEGRGLLLHDRRRRRDRRGRRLVLPRAAGAAPRRELAGLVAFYFNRMGRWLEEAEEITGHPRDPYHRIDVRPTDRHIRVSLDGELLADTTAGDGPVRDRTADPLVHPARRRQRATSSPVDTTTYCPYKGTAGYFSIQRDGGELAKDLVWFYADPLEDATRVRDLVCFFNEKVDIELDGVAAAAARVALVARRQVRRPERSPGRHPRLASTARSRRASRSGASIKRRQVIR